MVQDLILITLIIAFIFFVTTLSPQSVESCDRCGQEVTFLDRVERFKDDSGLTAAEILTLFENEINADFGIAFKFREGDLGLIVLGELIVPKIFEVPINRVIDNPNNYVEETRN